MKERRKFLRGFGLIGIALGSAAAAREAISNTSIIDSAINDLPVAEDINHLAPPEGAVSIQITGAYGEPPKPQVVSSSIGSSFYINGFNQETTHKVSMTVGLDNRLWIKVGDTWKRVAIEG